MDKKLTYTIIWSEEDAEYVCTSSLYPSLSWLSPDPIEALRGYVAIIDASPASPDEDVLMILKELVEAEAAANAAVKEVLGIEVVK